MLIHPWHTMLVLALLIVAPRARADDDPAKADFELQPVRRQVLPGSLDMVYVGPDGRIWRVEHSRKNSYRAARRRIEAEFHSPTPLLLNTRILDFEPGGRIWFTLPDGSREGGHVFKRYGRLFGHDGNTVIEREADERKVFEVGCRNHAVGGQGRAAKVDGKLFFPDTHGVHVFDGNDWSYEQLVAFEKFACNSVHRVMMLPEPDGRGAVAIFCTDTPTAWRYGDGRWRALQLPSRSETDNETGKTRRRAYKVHHAAIAFGRLWTTRDRGVVSVLRSVALDPSQRKGKVEPLIADLAADAYQTREAATSNLIARGEAVRPALEAALQDANDPERVARLNDILEQLAADDGPTWQFGPYPLANSEFQMHHDARGRVFLGAQKIHRDGQQVGPGLIVVDPNGRDRYYANADLGPGHIWGTITGELAVDEHRVWLVPRGGDPASLSDLQHGKVVSRILDKDSHKIRAVMRDGRTLSIIDRTAIARPPRRPAGASHAPDASGTTQQSRIFAKNVASCSVFLQVADGNVVAAPAPQAHHHHLANARDSRGDLWIEAFRADPNDPEWHLWRISHDRAEPTIRMPKGRKVYLIDHDDNLWLGPVGGEGVGPSDFVIVRDGERVGRVDCPVRIHPGAIVSGGPGWVYAVSARGLEHFVAPDDRPGDYRLEPHRPLDHAYRHDKTRPSPMRGQDIRLAAGRRLVVEAHMGVNSTAPREVNGRQIIPLPDPR